jgi:hypothetical protein
MFLLRWLFYPLLAMMERYEERAWLEDVRRFDELRGFPIDTEEGETWITPQRAPAFSSRPSRV